MDMKPEISTTTASGKIIDTSFAGSIPEKYDAYLGPIFMEPYAVIMAQRVAASRPSNVLEIACGTGRVTRHLITALPADAKITATDLSEGMIAEAAKLVDPKGTANIEWAAVDAGDLPYADNSFDALVCQFGIMFFPDRVKAYSEARRVLRPNGKFIALTWDGLSSNPLPAMLDRLLHEFFPTNAPQFCSIPFGYHNELTIRHEFESAGFSDIQLVHLKLDGRSSSAEAAAIGLLEANPLVKEILELGPNALPKMKQRLETDIADRFGNSEIVVPMQACMIEATAE